jgi:hypothetical protein
MKKQLLALSLLLASFGLFSQSTVWQHLDANTGTLYGARHLSAVDSSTCWAIFGNGVSTTQAINQFTRTTDGMTFTVGTFLPDTFSFMPSNICAVNDTMAFISTYNKGYPAPRASQILKTIDGGVNWTVISDTLTMFTGADNFANVVHFFDTNIGWCMGDPNNPSTEFEMYTTMDGGNTWTQVPGANIPNPLTSGNGEYGLTDIYATYGTGHIWFGTTAGRVLHSADTGKTWTVSTVGGIAAGVAGLTFRDAQNGLVWGRNTTSGPVVLKKTSDGGMTWTTINITGSLNVGTYQFSAIPGRAAYMSTGVTPGSTTDYVTSVTTDDGATWNVLETGTTDYYRMLELQMLDSAHGWAGTFTDAGGLDGMAKFIGPVTPLTCPMSVTSTTATICSGNAVTLTASGAQTYTWSANAGSATTSTVTLSPSASDTYTVTGTAGSCTNTATFSLTVNPTPTVSATAANDTICNLNSAALSASGGTTYVWTGSGLVSTSGANVSTTTYTAAGTYSYVVTGTSTGCSHKDTVFVTVLPCVGIAEVNGTIAGIYPNPSKGHVTVELGKSTGGAKVAVVDMIGNTVYQQSVSNGTTRINLDLGTMPKGMYLLTVSNSTGSSTRKLIIE